MQWAILTGIIALVSVTARGIYSDEGNTMTQITITPECLQSSPPLRSGEWASKAGGLLDNQKTYHERMMRLWKEGAHYEKEGNWLECISHLEEAFENHQKLTAELHGCYWMACGGIRQSNTESFDDF